MVLDLDDVDGVVQAGFEELIAVSVLGLERQGVFTYFADGGLVGTTLVDCSVSVEDCFGLSVAGSGVLHSEMWSEDCGMIRW